MAYDTAAAGVDLKEHGIISRLRRKGVEIAGKAALVAAMGLMMLGTEGCSKAPATAEPPKAAAKTEAKYHIPKGEEAKKKEGMDYLRGRAKSAHSPPQDAKFYLKGFGDSKGVTELKLKEARLKARYMREKASLPPSIEGTHTTDDQGRRVTVEERWRQLMGTAKENPVRSADEVDRMRREIESLERHIGEKKVKALMDEFKKPNSAHPDHPRLGPVSRQNR